MKKLLIAVALLGLAGCGNAEEPSTVKQEAAEQENYFVTCVYSDIKYGFLQNRPLVNYEVINNGNIYLIETTDGVRSLVPTHDCTITANKDNK